MITTRPPLPPFTRESATQKVRMAEDGWNTRDPEISPKICEENTVGARRRSFASGPSFHATNKIFRVLYPRSIAIFQALHKYSGTCY